MELVSPQDLPVQHSAQCACAESALLCSPALPLRPRGARTRIGDLDLGPPPDHSSPPGGVVDSTAKAAAVGSFTPWIGVDVPHGPWKVPPMSPPVLQHVLASEKRVPKKLSPSALDSDTNQQPISQPASQLTNQSTQPTQQQPDHQPGNQPLCTLDQPT